jgi:hypothetical protein
MVAMERRQLSWQRGEWQAITIHFNKSFAEACSLKGLARKALTFRQVGLVEFRTNFAGGSLLKI